MEFSRDSNCNKTRLRSAAGARPVMSFLFQRCDDVRKSFHISGGHTPVATDRNPDMAAMLYLPPLICHAIKRGQNCRERYRRLRSYSITDHFTQSEFRLTRASVLRALFQRHRKRGSERVRLHPTRYFRRRKTLSEWTEAKISEIEFNATKTKRTSHESR
jgi:hypothetical protein